MTRDAEPPFDPDAAAMSDALFGLPEEHSADALVRVIPAPYEATTSYRTGAAMGPELIRAASRQVDLLDRRFGEPFRAGIRTDESDARIATLSAEAGRLARPIVEAGGPASEAESAAAARVDDLAAEAAGILEARVGVLLDAGKVPAVLGGEHSVSLGPIRASAARGPVGVLQLDAHMDLRDRFEGFASSHASVMRRVVAEVADAAPIVQVGIRDAGPREAAFAESASGRVLTHWDADWHDARAGGTPLDALIDRALEPLPERVYVTFDIDALDPALCPGTGTPVPGGLGFHEACRVLERLAGSGRRIVAFDLVETSPGPGGLGDPSAEYNGAVAARILYALVGAAARSAGVL